MITIKKGTTSYFLAASALLVLPSLSLFGQDAHRSDTEQIMTLMKKLTDHSASPDALLDPALGDPARKSSLDYFIDPYYQLTLVPRKEIKIEPDGRATVPVRVYFKNRTSSLDAPVNVKFIKRGDSWYFANFDFLGWPPILLVVVIVMPTLGAAYGIGVLIVWSRLKKQGRLKRANFIKIFIPVFWPKLFRERG
jgi:hypothetical protein